MGHVFSVARLKPPMMGPGRSGIIIAAADDRDARAVENSRCERCIVVVVWVQGFVLIRD